MKSRFSFKLWIILAVFAAFALTAGAQTYAGAPSPPDPDPVKIEKVTHRLKWIRDIMSGGAIIAQEKGFFAKHGLEVEVLAGGFELDPVKLVAAGSDTFGVTGADTLILAVAKGIPIVAIGLEYQQTPVVFITKKESGITTPQDFVGKKVGVKFGTDVGTIYQALMAKLGIDRQQIIEVPVKWDMTPFFTNQIDVLPGYVINQPLMAKRQGFDVNIIKTEDYGFNFYGNVYFTSKKTLQERPDLVQKFMAGVVDGWMFVTRHKDESINVIMDLDKELNREHQEEQYDAMLPLLASTVGRFCWMTQEGWQVTHDTLLQIGMLEKPLDINEIYTMEPLQKVYR